MDYKQEVISGTQWQRCNSIHLQNAYGQAPQITMQEEQITTADDQQFRHPVGGITIQFDPGAAIPLLNPADGMPTGATMTQGQVHVAMWSLYKQQAALRDAAAQ